MAVSRPYLIRRPRINKSAFHFEVLNIILQFELDPSRGSLVITAEKTSRKDGQTDGQDRNIYASSPLGGGIINYLTFLNT